MSAVATAGVFNGDAYREFAGGKFVAAEEQVAVLKLSIAQSPAEREQGVVSCAAIVIEYFPDIFGRFAVIEHHFAHASRIAKGKPAIGVVVTSENIAERLCGLTAAPIGHHDPLHHRGDGRDETGSSFCQHEDDGFAG